MIGARGRFRFISKDDVADWPVFGTLARLQNTLFVSRTRKTDTGKMADTMRQALADGDRLVLFAEGTTSDGGQVLPFRPALLGALVDDAKDVMVQPFTIAYLRRDGLPISRGQRATLGWYGDLDLLPSLLDIIHGGPLDVVMVLGEPMNVAELGGRKRAAKAMEQEVRQTLAMKLRGRDR
jgi:1-acyl-sn-glycerol-3-phosphate acyltransferase